MTKITSRIIAFSVVIVSIVSLLSPLPLFAINENTVTDYFYIAPATEQLGADLDPDQIQIRQFQPSTLEGTQIAVGDAFSTNDYTFEDYTFNTSQTFTQPDGSSYTSYNFRPSSGAGNLNAIPKDRDGDGTIDGYDWFYVDPLTGTSQLVNSWIVSAPPGSVWATDIGGLPDENGNSVPLENGTLEEDPYAEGGATDTTANCRGFALAWLLCGMINALADIGDYLIQQFIVPFLQSRPLAISNGEDNIFKVWSTFRVIANIILVAALIFVIFGNAMGSGFAEAYLAKKSLPRIFIAAILINTSIYIAAGMIDITNVVGRSIGQLMMAPFNAQGAFLFNLGGFAATGLTLGMIGGAVFVANVAGVIPFLLLFVLLPAVVAMLAVFITLVMRQGLLLFLVIISPIAFALYALPNTAKYFGKWWDMFFKTLLVYPIVMVVIALSNILSVLVNEADSTTSNPGAKTIVDLVSIFLMLAPLFIIPFAFKLAGGLTGQVFGAVSGMGKKGLELYKGNPRDPDSRQSRVRRDFKSGRIQARAGAVDMLSGATGKSRSPFIRYPARGLTRALNLGNLQQQRGAISQQADQLTSDMAEGREATVRALFARLQEKDETITDKNGNDQELKAGNYYSYYEDQSGRKEAYSQADVDNAHKIVKNDPSMLQSFSKYEFGKAQNNGTVREFKQRFLEITNDANYTPEEADRTWYQVKYAHKGTRLEEKHTSVGGTRGNLQFNGVNHSALSNELADSSKSFDFANFRSSTAVEAGRGYSAAMSRAQAAEAAGGQVSQADADIIKNYHDVASNLTSALSTGTLGSAEAHREWSEFHRQVLGNQRQGRHTP